MNPNGQELVKWARAKLKEALGGPTATRPVQIVLRSGDGVAGAWV